MLGMSTQVAAESSVIPEWSLGDRLRKIRRLSGHSQAEFAALLDENQKTYAAWELDTSVPRNVVTISKRVEVATGVPAAWLLGLQVTGPTTARYPAPSPRPHRTLSLVPTPPTTYPDVSTSNRSSAPTSRNDTTTDCSNPSGSVNNGNAA